MNVGSTVRAAEKSNPHTVVRTAERFTIGPVGYAGQESSAETAFREILSTPDAAKQFETLISSASVSGQLYALLGLKLAKSAQFKKHLKKYESDGTPVETMDGCIVEHTTVKALARKIRKGKYK